MKTLPQKSYSQLRAAPVLDLHHFWKKVIHNPKTKPEKIELFTKVIHSSVEPPYWVYRTFGKKLFTAYPPPPKIR